MRKSILVLAGAIVIAAGGVSYAISGNQAISACVEPAGQNLTLAPPGGCPAGQQTLSWNQQGPQGDQGIQGVQGPAGQNGAPGNPASAANAVLHLAPLVKYRGKFSTSIVVSGVGNHLVSGHVHMHLTPTKWRHDGHVDCQMADPDNANLDSWTLPVKAKSAVVDMDIDLDGLVNITAAPSSPQTVQPIGPPSETVQFGCKTTLVSTSASLAPIFSFVRMSDELLTDQVVKLPVKEAVLQIKKIGP
jgi:hypothetical protein